MADAALNPEPLAGKKKHSKKNKKQRETDEPQNNQVT